MAPTQGELDDQKARHSVVRLDYAIWPEDYNRPVCEQYWWDRFEFTDGLWAKAYSLLEK
jgi:hypothetical protein